MQTNTIQFWLGWTIVTLIGFVVGNLAFLPFVINLAYGTQLPFLLGLISGAVLGATIGSAQWLLLRQRTPVTVAWVAASIVGGMIGMALGMSLGEGMFPVTATAGQALNSPTPSLPSWNEIWQSSLNGILFGIGMGWAQWRQLRRYARSTAWWIFNNGAAWMAALGIGTLLAGVITPLGAFILTGLIAAAITGYFMERWQWEMRKRTGPIPGRS